MTDEQFLHGVENWSNHRFLLLEALKLTEGDVVEMGMGSGSTPFLAKYCEDAGRKLFSYENNLEWYEKCRGFNPKRSFHISDWDIVADNHLTPSILFIDSAPGERRQIDLKNFALRARIIVAHDTEPAADHGYKMRQHIPLFRFWRDYQGPGAWASMASNFIEL